MRLIKNVKLIKPDEILSGWILFSDKIERISDDNDELQRYLTDKKDLEIIDGQGKYLSPGFIDIHIHGSAGFDTMDGNQQALDEIAKSLLKTGVTSFLPTTMSMPVKDIQQALQMIKEKMGNEKQGLAAARILGCHLEGPFISKEYKGAQASENIIGPDINLVDKFKDIIKIATVAPEVEGAEELIRYLSANGIISSAGHTAATYDDIMAARSWGLSHTTHLFNAMTKFHHREPGLIGAALTTDMSCELIADFIHLHPAVIKLVLRAKELNKIILITDQMRAGTLIEGEYDLGGQKVIVKDGSARLENGQLAGSVLTLDRAVRNLRKISELPVNKIINMVTYNPATLLNIEDIGLLAEGKRADMLILNDDLDIQQVYKDGQKQF